MIEALIGLALGAGGMWLWMRGRVNRLRVDRDEWRASWDIAARRANREKGSLNDARAINRLNGEAVQYWQDIATRIRTLCSKRKDSTAIAVMKMIGDGK